MSGPIIFSDLFVGEKYDARKELSGWLKTDYDDSNWDEVKEVDYPIDNLVGQSSEPVIIKTPANETVVDVGKIVAGFVEFSLTAKAGIEIKLEHSEVLDTNGNYYNNILGTNKEQTDIYITKDGFQTFRPHFTYHGFRYIRITNWPQTISLDDFKINVISSDMESITITT